MTDFIYDLETYPNCFTFAIAQNNEDHVNVFECSPRRNDIEHIVKLMVWLKDNNHRMVGFNNVGFDYPILHDLMTNIGPDVLKMPGDEIAKFCSNKCNDIFASGNRWKHAIREGDRFVKQIDLYLINHYDNVSRSTGLKQLEFAMRSESIQDLPFPVEDLTNDQIAELVTYNKHDVLQTMKFYNYTTSRGSDMNLEAVQFREELSDEYGWSFMDYNDTKIGKELFIHRLETNVGKDICYSWNGKKRRPRQTIRESLELNTIINPLIKFENESFNTILNWVSNVTLDSVRDRDAGMIRLITKDVFTNLDLMSDNPFNDALTEMTPEHDVVTYTNLMSGDDLIYRYRNNGSTARMKKEVLKHGVENLQHVLSKKTTPNLATTINDLKYVFGLGGLHASVDSKIITADDDHFILDMDVTSYYPSLSITQGAYPDHLGEAFCTIYQDVKDERISHEKGTVGNAALKLALNGVYGDSNNKFSPFYDPAFTMRITINGQLFIAMLCEQLVHQGAEILQANTDGLTIRGSYKDAKRLLQITKDWQSYTSLDLEYVEYQTMFIRDVNNYIAVKKDGSKKLKGCYEHERGMERNHSQLCVPKAAVEHLTTGTPIIDILEKNKDIYDFMCFVKMAKGHRLEAWDDDSVVELQKNTRFLVVNDGHSLMKIMPPLKKAPNTERPQAIKSGCLIQEVNDMNDRSHGDLFNNLNMEYYVEEVEKLCELTTLEIKK